MSGRLLESDPITKTRVDWHAESDGSAVVNTRQDVEPVVEMNKEQYNVSDGRYGKGPFHHVARIPKVVAEKLWREGILDDPKALKKWLDDPDNRVWKTHPGRLS